MSVYRVKYFNSFNISITNRLYEVINSNRLFFTARFYAERGYATVCRLSVCLSVRDVQVPTYRDHIGWNTSKGLMLGLTPISAIWCNGNTPIIRVE